MAIQFDNNKKVTQDLGVKPIEAYKNLVVGEIISVEVTEKISESTTGYQFAGFAVPNIVIKFKQAVNAFNADDRFATIVLKPVVGIKNTGVKMAEKTFGSLVMSQFDHLKHILDTFEGTANFKALGKLNDIDMDADTETLLKQFKTFYTTFAKAFAGKDGEGCYKGSELVFKFVVNKGEKRLAVPNYVNKGYVQLAKYNKAGKLVTTLEFYGETTEIPKNISAANAPVGAGAPAAPVAEIDLNSI